MENAVSKLGFSARGYGRILKRVQTTRRADLVIALELLLELTQRGMSCRFAD
jgi:hypothetical protein